ncbi:hypothetical protein [Oceanobacillus kapialis]|uniref:Phage protein n=1 Tax=Oceanobacillus kapialis TaxID=481353 RepID=A0ABW5PZU3_9BACI
MEITTYDERQAGTTKLFFKMADGQIQTVTVGNQAVSKDSGYQFYVDDHVAEQIEKCELYFDGLKPKLRVKDGEEIITPEKTEREKEIDRLEFELEQLRNAQ